MLSMRKRILNEMEGKSMARMESKSVRAGGIYLRKRTTKQCNELTAKRDEILTAIAHYV